MNYIKITRFDTANGPGIREVLWVAGCPHHCEGCHNEFTWNPNQGYSVTNETISGIIQDLSEPFRKGLTFSGGDPLAPYNRLQITQIAKLVRETYPKMSIWCYTGYTWENLQNEEILQYLDVLVDSKFILSQRDITLPYCGSGNQRVIDVQKSLQQNSIVLW